MAKENTVFLYGMVDQPPKVRVTENGDYISGRITLYTVRRSGMNDHYLMTGATRVDFPCVFSKNRHVIKHMIEPLSRGDYVIVKGSLCTADSWREYICPECGAKIIEERAVIVYVDPLEIMKVGNGPEIREDYSREELENFWENYRNEAYRKINDNSEISNLVMIMGQLTRDPVYYSAGEDGKKETQFQIVSPRKRRIREDPPEKNADFPWVKAFGMKALEYYDALHERSKIYINGAIETRTVAREIDCDKCGHHYTKDIAATEIVPYDIEYMENCNLPESTHLEDEEYEE